jgi:hypothetical protein
MTDDAGPYRVRILRRIRVDGILVRPGQTLLVPRDRLAVVDFHVKTGAGRPADEETARDLELWRLLRQALPAADDVVATTPSPCR